MQRLKKLMNLLQLIFLVMKMFLFPPLVSQEISVSYCGGIRIEPPAQFFHQNSSLLRHMIICKSDKLYFRTTIGLFDVSSINYTDRHITVSHNTSSCSSSSASNFVSPHHLSAGFPPFSKPNNSLVLFNCSNIRSSRLRFSSCDHNNNNTDQFISGCFNSEYHEQESGKGSSFSASCLVIDDAEKLEKDFHPKQMNCTHYSRVYKNVDGLYELGTRVSFDIPDHVPNPCNECEKPYGNCGVGLRCVCHPKECKDKVISAGEVMKPCSNILLCLVFLIMLGFFRGCDGYN